VIQKKKKLGRLVAASVRERLAEALHLQAMEANPLRSDEVAMFEMFEQEEWSPEDRRTCIARRLKNHKGLAAVE
jgi:hypothetical protein